MKERKRQIDRFSVSISVSFDCDILPANMVKKTDWVWWIRLGILASSVFFFIVTPHIHVKFCTSPLHFIRKRYSFFFLFCKLQDRQTNSINWDGSNVRQFLILLATTRLSIYLSTCNTRILIKWKDASDYTCLRTDSLLLQSPVWIQDRLVEESHDLKFSFSFLVWAKS